MAAVRTFTLPHYDAYPVHVALFQDVTNADFLRSQLLAANPDFDYAFLDAAMILTPLHLLTATFHTLHTILHRAPKTRTAHSELIYRLSPTNNIGESYKTFGISPLTTSLIVVKLNVAANGSIDERVTREAVEEHLGRVVQGTSVPIGDQGAELGAGADVHRIKKVYKIGCAKGGRGKKGGGAAEGKEDRTQLEAVVLGAIALKGA